VRWGPTLINLSCAYLIRIPELQIGWVRLLGRCATPHQTHPRCRSLACWLGELAAAGELGTQVGWVGWEEVAWVDRHFDDELRLKAEVSWNR